MKGLSYYLSILIISGTTYSLDQWILPSLDRLYDQTCFLGAHNAIQHSNMDMYTQISCIPLKNN